MKTLIYKYLSFFDLYIKNELNIYFQTEKIQNKINQFDYNIKIYAKCHYIKSHNLILSLFLLARGVDNYKLPDEAKIIFRSLFEHLLNYMYIFSKDNDDEKNELIEDYNLFFDVQQFKFIYHIAKQPLYENDSKIKKMIYSNAQKVCKDNNLEELFENHYNKKYKKNRNSWHGYTIQDLIMKISKKYGDEFLLLGKYYSSGNLYTHCNIMDYMNEEGIIVGNTSLIEVLDVLENGLSFYISYIDWFYRCIGIEIFKEKFPKILEEYYSLRDDYEKIKKTIS